MMVNMDMRIGWARQGTISTMKFHFYSRGRSLCGRHEDSGNGGLLTIRPSIPLDSCCSRCLDRRSR